MCVYIYIYIYVYIYIYMYVYIYIYIYLFICPAQERPDTTWKPDPLQWDLDPPCSEVYTSLSLSLYIYIYGSVYSIYIYIDTHVYICVCIYTYTIISRIHDVILRVYRRSSGDTCRTCPRRPRRCTPSSKQR